MQQGGGMFAAELRYLHSNKTISYSILSGESSLGGDSGIALEKPTGVMEDRVQSACVDNGDECQISLSGRITMDSSPDLRALLLKRLQSPNCRSLTVDFCEVPYIDTSGLATLVEVLKSARASGKVFRLTGLQERPRFLLEETRLLHLFDEVSSG
jgi:anti-sigma B factor antagonist